jgi:hypothetical protein
VKPVSVCLFVATAILCGGCGGTHKQASIPASAPQAPAQAAKPLAAAIYASCGVDTFAPPTATATSKTRPPSGWQVTYLYPPRAPQRPRPGQTTIVTLVERPPVGPPPKLAGGREITVAGRRVSLVNRTKKTIYVAVWKTGRARYTALADGAKPTALKRIIACLP